MDSSLLDKHTKFDVKMFSRYHVITF